jgi:hypothetical protein
MKKITKYEANNGDLFETEKEAIRSDNLAIVNEVAEEHLDGQSLEYIIDNIRKNPVALQALLDLLEVDTVAIDSQRIIDDFNESAIQEHQKSEKAQELAKNIGKYDIKQPIYSYTSTQATNCAICQKHSIPHLE